MKSMQLNMLLGLRTENLWVQAATEASVNVIYYR